VDVDETSVVLDTPSAALMTTVLLYNVNKITPPCLLRLPDPLSVPPQVSSESPGHGTLQSLSAKGVRPSIEMNDIPQKHSL